MTDDEAAAGSLLEADYLEAEYPFVERYRLQHLWNASNTHDVPCLGCGTGVRTLAAGRTRGCWCDHCLPIATDMSQIRSAAKKFVRYGLTDAAAAAEKALADLRVAMRARGTSTRR